MPKTDEHFDYRKIYAEKASTHLRRSSSAASGPGMVIVILDGAATLYFFANGLHTLIFTSNSKMVLAKTLITGEIIDGKKLEKLELTKEQLMPGIYLANENDADISPLVPF